MVSAPLKSVTDHCLSNGDNLSIIYTSHDQEKIDKGSELLIETARNNSGITLDEVTHNHPNNASEGKMGLTSPSGPDRDQAFLLKSVYKGQKSAPQFFIRAGAFRREYDESGKIDR